MHLVFASWRKTNLHFLGGALFGVRVFAPPEGRLPLLRPGARGDDLLHRHRTACAWFRALSGFGVWCLGFGVQDSGCGSSEFGVWGSGFRFRGARVAGSQTQRISYLSDTRWISSPSEVRERGNVSVIKAQKHQRFRALSRFGVRTSEYDVLGSGFSVRGSVFGVRGSGFGFRGLKFGFEGGSGDVGMAKTPPSGVRGSGFVIQGSGA